MRKMREMISSPSSADNNEVVFNNGVASRDSKGIEVLSATCNRCATSSGDASYVLTLLKPMLGHSGSPQKGDNGYKREEIASKERN